MLRSLIPSPWARELVRGAFDLHVHVAPDAMPRIITDLELARRYRELGLGGFVLKSHYLPTQERAAVVSAAVPGILVLGAICLNASVGGLNPLAVEIAAREGARVVWLPTVDAANHRLTRERLPEGATPPMWLALQKELEAQGMEVAPVEVLDQRGRVVGPLRGLLQLIARHELVLATGHLSAEEAVTVALAAREAGVRQVVATHPEFPQQDMALPQQLELAGAGVYLERCFSNPFTGKSDWSQMVANIRATGVENTVFSTDLGQPQNPPVEDGLALSADALKEAGFEEEEVRTMVVANGRLLAGVEA